MSLAAILWAIVAMMQLCMTSQIGIKKLNNNFLAFNHARSSLKILSFIFMGVSLYLNCLDNGVSVGIISWFFLIITSAFFLQILFFYHFKKWVFLIWIFLFLLAAYYLLTHIFNNIIF
ncbi:hypothetical protein NVT87_10070 [Acinetobacter radioresistens]|jgi:hypothetical protein|uniref:hypothetical protein n=1 Tax=Acinetobacter radioresistens TaxID=40216 RepID=UPI0020047397|nr:hypothetical protein [Acinetobacter radioresistens]MCK4087313.1 hypothetical protein [Acinetobacter radioresistens]MCK4106988.1 hypothetical protein [Acinetobacter radioresistens]MCX0331225.1 hypothetical protein [Acinetobacter radioresistens]